MNVTEAIFDDHMKIAVIRKQEGGFAMFSKDELAKINTALSYYLQKAIEHMEEAKEDLNRLQGDSYVDKDNEEYGEWVTGDFESIKESQDEIHALKTLIDKVKGMQ